MKTLDGIIEGYKVVKIATGKKGDPVLTSLNGLYIYAPRRANHAKHFGVSSYRSPSDLCPHQNDRCGFNILRYGIDQPNNSKSDIRDLFVYQMDKSLLVRFRGWGKVIPGEYGFRCQYSYPKSIIGNNPEGCDCLYDIDITANYPDKTTLWKIARLYKISLEIEA